MSAYGTQANPLDREDGECPQCGGEVYFNGRVAVEPSLDRLGCDCGWVGFGRSKVPVRGAGEAA